MGDKHLLDYEQMAHFVADGYLQFDGLLSEEVCQQISAEFESGVVGHVWPDFHSVPPDQRPGQPFANLFRDTAVGNALRSDAVAGILDSLIGPDPLYDHHA